jgi:hypothetical protein
MPIYQTIKFEHAINTHTKNTNNNNNNKTHTHKKKTKKQNFPLFVIKAKVKLTHNFYASFKWGFYFTVENR